jgi:hypothetical protein
MHRNFPEKAYFRESHPIFKLIEHSVTDPQVGVHIRHVIHPEIVQSMAAHCGMRLR